MYLLSGVNWILILGFLTGISLGSFIKVVADRSISKRSFWGRSYCEACQHQLSWYDLLPILSFVLLGGKCRYCGSPIRADYLLIEVGMGILTVWLFWQKIPDNFLSLLGIVFELFIISVLAAVFLTDLKKGLIPDRITYPAITGAFFYLLVLSVYKIFLTYQSISSSLLGKYLLPPHSDYFFRHAFLAATPFLTGIVSAAVLGLFFGVLIILTRGRGMGGGDLKLALFIGLTFGFPNSLVVLMLAFFLGSLAGITLLIFKKRKLGQTIPFAPFLSLGGLITIFWGEKIVSWYLNLKVN